MEYHDGKDRRVQQRRKSGEDWFYDFIVKNLNKIQADFKEYVKDNDKKLEQKFGDMRNRWRKDLSEKVSLLSFKVMQWAIGLLIAGALSGAGIWMNSISKKVDEVKVFSTVINGVVVDVNRISVILDATNTNLNRLERDIIKIDERTR